VGNGECSGRRKNGAVTAQLLDRRDGKPAAMLRRAQAGPRVQRDTDRIGG
jgi:hypothetical protein